MFKNYLKIAWRNITRHKAYSTLNIAGLSIGMACSILILLWVQNELSYDTFHTNAASFTGSPPAQETSKLPLVRPGMAEGLASPNT
jgi:hypothetical protein